MPATADRLSFHWSPSFSPAYRLDVSITEARPRAGDRVTRYMVEPTEELATGRTFLVAKDSDTDPAVYEVYVAPTGHACTCKGAVGHRQNVTCKHVRMCRKLVEDCAI